MLLGIRVSVRKATEQVMKGFHCDIGILSYFLNLTDSTSTLLLPGQYVCEVAYKISIFSKVGCYLLAKTKGLGCIL